MPAMTPDQEEEISKAIVAHQTTRAAFWEAPDRGLIKISLVRSDDDFPLFSPESQAELEEVRSALRNDSIDAPPPFMVMDSPAAGNGWVWEFLIQGACKTCQEPRPRIFPTRRVTSVFP
jgi:hypothetical protein